MQFRPVFPFLGSSLRHRSRPFRIIGLKFGATFGSALGLTRGAMLALVALGAAPATIAAQQAGASVRITVTNLRNTDGVIMACMTTNADRFPRCRDDAGSHRATVSASGSLLLEFNNVLPGTYAIALLHDENENGRADRALTLIPREGFGFSRDAPVRMGPPDFEDAAFEVDNAPINQTIRMRYLL